MRQGFNVNFYCRQSKCTKGGYAPIELSVNINGKRQFINLPFKCLPSDFNKKRQPKEIADYVTSMRKRINEVLSEMAVSGEILTTQALVKYIKNGGFQSYTVEDLFEEYYAILRKRIGTTLTKKVYVKYELVRNLFFTIVDKNSECANITPADVQMFKVTCESKYMPATTGGYLQKLKTVLTFAQDNGRLKINPFQGVKINKGTPTLEFLSMEDINRLRSLEIENESLSNVRNIFLFQICSGLSFADMEKLRVEDIQEKDGVLFIKKNRQKTGVEFVSVLLPFVKDLFLFDNQGVRIGFKFKMITNQKLNSYLHVIERAYNFSQSLHSLAARHTYCYLLLNNYKVRAETAARAMGHTNPKTTLKYYANISTETAVNEIGSKMAV